MILILILNILMSKYDKDKLRILKIKIIMDEIKRKEVSLSDNGKS